MLTRLHTADDLFKTIETFIDTINSVNKVAKIKLDFDTTTYLNTMYGRLKRNEVKYTKSQIARIFKPYEFDLQQYLNTFDTDRERLVSYVKVAELPVNFKHGKMLVKPTPFPLHGEVDDCIYKALHNQICKYQACYIVKTLINILNQYVHYIFNKPTQEWFEYNKFFGDYDCNKLRVAGAVASLAKDEAINKIAQLSLFTEYYKDLVKLIVSTKYLNLDNYGVEDTFVFNSLKTVINHEYDDSYTNGNHERKFRADVRAHLNFKAIED